MRRVSVDFGRVFVFNRSALGLAATFCALFIWVGCKSQDASPKPEPPQGTAATQPSPQSVKVLLAYGSEKKSWLVDAIGRFNASGQKLKSGEAVEVVGQAVGSGTAVEDLIDGTTQAHAWAPASSMYREVLNRAWTARQGAVGGKKELADAGKSLVLSPVVLAMWKPMAQALGWPDKPVGWGDVLALAKDPKGWATKGHPEWGAFKFGHTHPMFSNSGSLAVLAAVYSAAGESRGLDAAMLAKPQTATFLEAIEESVVHYGKSTGFFADKMLTRGPSFLSAAVLYENLVVDSYQRPEYQNRALDLVCVYPKEGTFWIDNPYYVLDAPWSDARQQEGAALLRDFLLSGPEQTRAMTNFGFRPATPNIAIAAPLDAAHGVDPKQPQRLLELPDIDNVTRSLELWKKVKKVVDIVFVFDHSGSMNGEPLVQAKQGALDFITQLDDRDQVSLLLFNHQVHDPEDPAPLAKKRAAINDTLGSTFAVGGTALYDAIAAAHDKLSKIVKKNPNHIVALVVLSDGRDEHSQSTLDMLRERLKPPSEIGAENPVRLFTIAYGSGADTQLLGELAEKGGGAAFVGDTKSIRQVYRDLAAFF